MLEQGTRPTIREWADVPYVTDQGFGARAHIGMVVIDCDQTLSHEARAMLALPGVALYESRISSQNQQDRKISVDLLQNTFNGLDLALAQINSRRTSDVIALGCTSAAMVIGPQALERRVNAVHPGARVTDPFTGINAALSALGSARLGFVSPYPRDVAEKMIAEIEGNGFEVPAAVGFQSDTGEVRFDSPFISERSVCDAVRRVISQAEVDTVIVACTQMRVAAVIAALEAETGKAIVSSNQALCWHALRLAGCADEVDGWGRLFNAAISPK
ncbi:hypothetical protein RX327_31610 [Bradyrhizobium sp. BEA-2-5]|uniref:maleate cis-trans isomerase family protein n=1 Tax=Bradyrhizobium sp. BEA-2-5 TaxID=3080015 RepID=UPI00293EC1F9|nr:hypothetical protein [Bradyrhizobium sp. BEA-2-5]WOH80319.1 hypothetical protein RX327_31610 [Bradyrhizobium sp. BEA-2-5]